MFRPGRNFDWGDSLRVAVSSVVAIFWVCFCLMMILSGSIVSTEVAMVLGIVSVLSGWAIKDLLFRR